MRRPSATAQQRDTEFTQYALTAAPRLRDTAFLLCRDWHLAQDLTQTALIKLYLAWPKVRGAEHPDAYARNVLLRTFLDHRRRRSAGEVVIETVPDTASTDTGVAGSVDLRLTLLDALAVLKPLDRAVVVLRYWEDYSIEQVASLLEISQGRVKQRSLRGLAALRGVLHQDDPHARATLGLPWAP